MSGFLDSFRKKVINSVYKELGLDTNPALYNRLLERLATLEEDDIHLIHSILSRYESNRS